MLAIQPVSNHVRDEKLTTVRIGTCICHRQGSDAVFPWIIFYLVGKFIPGAATAGACRISALNHEPIDDAVKNRTVVESVLRENYEVVHRHGSILDEQV